MRVLIVEDDKVLGDGLSRYLNDAGYRTDVAVSGTVADSLLASEDFDVVILDIGLPGLDGLEVLRRMRTRKRYVPAIVLTARDAVEYRVQGLDMGADDYLVKPFALIELEARIRAVVRRGQAGDQGKIVYGDLVLDNSARRA